MPYSEAFPKEKAAAIKAIALDEALPEGHVQLAHAAMNLDWDWATEGKEFKRALELNPNSAPVRWAYSNYLERMGRLPEAISELQLALQLDPISSRAYITLRSVTTMPANTIRRCCKCNMRRRCIMNPPNSSFPWPSSMWKKVCTTRPFSNFRSWAINPTPWAIWVTRTLACDERRKRAR